MMLRGVIVRLFEWLETDELAFEHVKSWLDDLRAHADENVSIICKSFLVIKADLVVVANKTDLCSDTPPPLPDIAFGQAVPPSEQDDTPSPIQSPRASTDTSLRPRVVTPLEGALFAKQHGLLYVETSAKEGWHVVDAFEWTAREVLATVSRTELERKKVRCIDASRGVKLICQPKGVNVTSKKEQSGGCC
jgi:hypothetical protein